MTDFIVVLCTIFAIKNLKKTSSPQTKLAAHDVFAFSFDLCSGTFGKVDLKVYVFRLYFMYHVCDRL